ncbi:TIGR00730 family Rossman fold protein [Spirillospora sp. CA-128828]|uniref:LOG family protein n=1 Tax=Spirillospora sp. CA-128828 TaxID=3240033 RepID=UPI003D8A1DE6
MTKVIHPPGSAGEEGAHLLGLDEAWIQAVAAEFREGFTALNGVQRLVTVFGSAQTVPGSDEYQLGVDIGAQLVTAGFAVMTGGGPGAMEAANRGARSQGGLSVGLGVVLPNEQQMNRYLDIEVVFKELFTRKFFLVRCAQAIVVTPGGFGTLDELFEALTQVKTKTIGRRPIVLVGDYFWDSWMSDIHGLVRAGKISENDLKLLSVVNTAEQVVEAVSMRAA